MSSIPAEIRTRPSVMPIAARRSGGTDACVIVAGCEMSVSTPPRLSASDISWTPLKRARRVERSHLEGQHAAEALHLARREFVLGVIGQPGVVDLPHSRMKNT